jgi:hypothetical protein
MSELGGGSLGLKKIPRGQKKKYPRPGKKIPGLRRQFQNSKKKYPDCKKKTLTATRAVRAGGESPGL